LRDRHIDTQTRDIDIEIFYVISRSTKQRERERENMASPKVGSVSMILAAVSGASSVAMAAYGAHGTKGMSEAFRKSYNNGNKLHMIHSTVLLGLALGVAGDSKVLKRPKLTTALFASGILLFSGSCYLAALTGNRKNGRFAPIGGTALILGWLSLVL
jgi:uncharacterized membrane protein YgdD (TMEM256/DUF423 family)